MVYCQVCCKYVQIKSLPCIDFMYLWVKDRNWSLFLVTNKSIVTKYILQHLKQVTIVHLVKKVSTVRKLNIPHCVKMTHQWTNFTIPCHFGMINFNISILSAPRSPKWCDIMLSKAKVCVFFISLIFASCQISLHYLISLKILKSTKCKSNYTITYR